MSIEFITFLLAIIGYVGLTANAILASLGRIDRWFMTLVAMVIITHVFMVWAFRYEWQFSLATRNGYVGFLLFHSALVFIIVSTSLNSKWARRLTVLSFLIVSAGAIGATLIYAVVSIYRWPVILIFLTGMVFILKRVYTNYIQRT